MGCDIHLYAERLVTPKWWQFWKKRKWVSIDKYTRNPDFGECDNEPEFVIESENRIGGTITEENLQRFYTLKLDS